MKRSRFAVASGACWVAMIAAALLAVATAARAAEPKASIDGVTDRSLRQEIQRAIGEFKTKPQSRFDARRRAEEAAGDAIALLRSEGYYAYDVQPDVSEADPPQPVVHVTPGPRFRFKNANVAWIGAPPDEATATAGRDALELKTGEPGRAADVLAAEGRVVAAVEKRGYADAEVRPREVIVDHADQSMTPTLNVATGELVHLDGIDVVTDGRTNPAWVRGLAPWKSGAAYDPDKVAELERRLRDVSVYDSITVALAPKDKAINGLRPVVVSLADRPPRTLELGFGYSTSEGPGGDARWIFYNRFRRADTITFTAKIAQIEQKLDVELALPHWKRPGQTLRVGADLFGDNTDAYTDHGAAMRLDVERRFTRTSYITLGGDIDYTDISEKSAVNAFAAPVGVHLKLFILTGLTAFALDKSNDPLDPVRGWRLEARAEPTFITGTRSLAYLKVQTQASVYVPLNAQDSTVIAARAKIGSLLGGRILDVPADRRFFAGGGGSLRGYAYQAVGPRLSDNTPEGGLSLFETSLEVRQKITRQWGVVAFVDAGTVSTHPAPDFANFAAGVGIGVRYDLGFGPLRVDIATPLNRQPGDARFQIYLSIGQSF